MTHISSPDITDKNNSPAASPLDALRRYVPLAVPLLVFLVTLAIPLKIVSYGYLPGDDALRHAAKAVSGKPWSEILVLGAPFRDQNFVWHDFLRAIYLQTHCSTDGLVVFSLVFLFVLVNWSVLPWLKRPEAWLITLTAITVTSGNLERMMLGRPFLITLFVLFTILCVAISRLQADPLVDVCRLGPVAGALHAGAWRLVPLGAAGGRVFLRGRIPVGYRHGPRVDRRDIFGRAGHGPSH